MPGQVYYPFSHWPTLMERPFKNDIVPGKHFLASVLLEQDETPNIEPPGRPRAPPPTPTPSAFVPRPASPSTFNLGPERPLKLFRLEDFEFLKILGTPVMDMCQYNIFAGTGTFGRVQLVKYVSKNVEKYFAMKILRKTEVVRLKQVDHVFSERSLLARLSFPFIVRL